MNKYAEIRKIAILYTACRGILRVKLAAATAQQQTQTQPQQNTQPQEQPQQMPTANGTTGGIVPPKQPPRQTLGKRLQDMLDWGSDYMKSNGALVTKEQQAEADSYNAQQHQQAMAGLAKGEWNDWDPSQQVSATAIQTGQAVKKENADAEASSKGSGSGNGTTVNVNLPEGYGGGGGGGAGDGGYVGGGQQFQQAPSFADYIQQYGQYRNRTA